MTTSERPNLGTKRGSVAPGDEVIARGHYVEVLRVIAHPPNTHPDSPIYPRYHAVEVVTALGSRWLGADRAYIGPDLRLYWHREG